MMLDAKMVIHPAQFGGETVPCITLIMLLKYFATVAGFGCTPLTFKSRPTIGIIKRKQAELGDTIGLYSLMSADQTGPSQQVVATHQKVSEQTALLLCLLKASVLSYPARKCCSAVDAVCLKLASQPHSATLAFFPSVTDCGRDGERARQ